MINAHAQSYCGYKDYFHISDRSHPAIFVTSGYSDSDILLDFIGPRSFTIRDGYQCRSGYAHVVIAADKDSWCTLDLRDGPYMNHPTVSASCNGLSFLGMDYDGIGSYSYTIKIG